MAEKLVRYYKYIYEIQGLSGKTLLAQKTKIPSIKAAFELDTPENIALFKQTIESLTGKPAPDF
ncbi:MAG: hypothetical protein RIS84_311 [Pseudomonadota bacterium]